MANLQIRLDENLKAQAITADMGMNVAMKAQAITADMGMNVAKRCAYFLRKGCESRPCPTPLTPLLQR